MPSRRRYTRNLGRVLPSPLPATVEWVRFEHRDEPFGVFSYLDDAGPKLPAEARAELAALRGWFAKHLDAPPGSYAIEKERFWFRAEAGEFVGRARRLADLVARAGIPMVERRTRELPGRVRWADPNQLAVLMEPEPARG